MNTCEQLITQYGAKVANLFGSSRTPATTQRQLIDLVQAAANMLLSSMASDLQDAGEEFDAAADHLTNALAASGTERELHFARAESHLRLALELAR
ncbi:hypothetical protein ABZX98_19220 [Streptomyces sp. NPDC002992]|uniref:hypothetical protein n=1 Tax=Streptomyces sp. NPDC002992 TaxID=3154273 RepID=UPI0033B104FD